jgi:para-nitrobenzyl esterase
MEKKLGLLRAVFGEYTDDLVALFQKGYPGKNELTLLDIDSGYRNNMLNYVERKVSENDAGVPAYVYLFALEFDCKDGRNASHATDLAFCFHNASRAPACNMPGMEKLQDEMSGAWASFARTGDPNHAGLVKWPTYNLAERPVMIFDRQSGVRTNHERKLISLHHKFTQSLPPVRNPGSYTPEPDEDVWRY